MLDNLTHRQTQSQISNKIILYPKLTTNRHTTALKAQVSESILMQLLFSPPPPSSVVPVRFKAIAKPARQFTLAMQI